MRVGILGGGQLGWMTILEGRKLGLSFWVLDKDPDAPASRVADKWFPPERCREFAQGCEFITYEFEHIEEDILEVVEEKLVPGAEPLRLKKRRSEEKGFLYKLGYPVPKFVGTDLEGLKQAVEKVGTPAVVKSEKLGYDGKGQYRVTSEEDLEAIKKAHSEGDTFVVEEWVDFEAEVSVIGVRDSSGRIITYPMTYNVHEEGILLYNRVANFPDIEKEAVDIVSSLLEDLKIVGLLAVEFFLTSEGGLLINEFAPRPHNTGHYTLDGAYTSQFENLLRAILNLPLGSSALKVPSGMVNILGMSLSELNVEDILLVEGAKLYWYNKEKKPRRKVGHVNILTPSEEGLREGIRRLLQSIYHREYSLI